MSIRTTLAVPGSDRRMAAIGPRRMVEGRAHQMMRLIVRPGSGASLLQEKVYD